MKLQIFSHWHISIRRFVAQYFVYCKARCYHPSFILSFFFVNIINLGSFLSLCHYSLALYKKDDNHKKERERDHLYFQATREMWASAQKENGDRNVFGNGKRKKYLVRHSVPDRRPTHTLNSFPPKEKTREREKGRGQYTLQNNSHQESSLSLLIYISKWSIGRRCIKYPSEKKIEKRQMDGWTWG